jgi:hypothetical protein
MGRKMSRVELVRAMRPQRRPKRSHCEVRGSRVEVRGGWVSMLLMRRARTRVKAKRAVVMVISHGQRTAYCMAAG